MILEMYKFGLSKILNKLICCNKEECRRRYNSINPHSVTVTIESNDADKSFRTDSIEVDTKCNNILSISIGVIWIIICLITCFIAVFGYDLGYGYVGKYKSDITDETKGWYGCYCKSSFACYFLWGSPHLLLELYFIITAIRAFSITVGRAMVDHARVVAYVGIRSIIVKFVCILYIIYIYI